MPRRLSCSIGGLLLSMAAIVLPGEPADASEPLHLLPFESFKCTGDACPLDFVSADGPDVAAAGRIAESAVKAGWGGQTREGNAMVGLRFTVCEPAEARVVVRGDYQGLLKGSYGGIVNRGWMDLFAVLLDDTAGEAVDQSLIVREEERGNAWNPITELTHVPQQNLPQEDGTDPGAVVEGAILPGRVYVAALRLRTKASGAAPRAVSDFKNDTRQARLLEIEIGLTPSLPDSDGDGLFDDWENEGLKDCEGNVVVPLHEMGADPDHKDVFVEHDWLPGSEPSAATIAFLKDRFAAAPADSGFVPDGDDPDDAPDPPIENPDGEPGINLWIDTGSLMEGGTLVGDDFGGGNEVELSDVPNGQFVPRVSGDADGNDIADFREVKDKSFDPARRAVFHYALGGPTAPGEPGPPVPGKDSCSDGVDNDGNGFIDGEDDIWCFNGGQSAGGANIFVGNSSASMLMHELGHSLGLGHGGDEPDNCKPNYLSIMNYVYSGGIPRDDNGNGIFEAKTIDYSGLAIDDDTRATAPLDDLVEDMLDETVGLDPIDPVHGIRWVDGTGAGRTSAIDEPIDWSGPVASDGSVTIDDNPVEVNLNRGDENGDPTACEADSAAAGHPSDETLTGNDDWHTLVFRFPPDSPLLDAPIIDVVEEPNEPPGTPDRIYFATDLRIEKEVEPNPWVGGQTVAYRLTASNHGPNGAAEVTVRDYPPPGVTFPELPEACELDADDAGKTFVDCALEPLAVGQSRTIELAARLPIATSCGASQFIHLSNTAEVINHIGGERRPEDNRVTARHQVLCPLIDYPAKLICGIQPAADRLALLRAAYGTAVNLHNPHDEEVYVFAKLALARLGGPVEAGPVLPVGLFSFAYDESMVIDCDVVRRTLDPDLLPAQPLDGFLVLQTARPIDVSAVYTTSMLDRAGVIGDQSSIDVETVAPRRREPPAPKADLAPAIIGQDLFCNNEVGCSLGVRYEVQNVGDAAAGPFTVTLSGDGATLAEDRFDDGLDAHALETRQISASFAMEAVTAGIEICIEADLPLDEVAEAEEANNRDCVTLGG